MNKPTLFIIDDNGTSKLINCIDFTCTDSNIMDDYIDIAELNKTYINAEFSFPLTFASGRKSGKSKITREWMQFFSKYYIPTLKDKEIEFKKQHKQEPFYRSKENFKRWSR